MLFSVKATQSGNSVSYEVEANDIKEGLAEAKKEAKKIFDYVPNLGLPEPRVVVKPSKEAIVEAQKYVKTAVEGSEIYLLPSTSPIEALQKV